MGAETTAPLAALKSLASHPQDPFVPAGAGNTPADYAAVEGASVHPRVRGEHLNSHKAGLWDDGSSPRIRGTLMAREWIVEFHRFIPAHTGNTNPAEVVRVNISVHPRACGEHDPLVGVARHVLGSSPRMRGTPIANPIQRRVRRFIPAHAGNTLYHIQRAV